MLLISGCSGKSRPFSDEALPLEGAGGAGAMLTPVAVGGPATTAPPGEDALVDPPLLAPQADSGGVAAAALGTTCTTDTDCIAPS